MPLTFPLPLSEFQERFTISSMQLKLPAVNQMSRTAGGAVIKASLGDELWKGSFSIPPTNSRSDAARIDGLISVLDRGGSFLAFHAAKTHPASDPDGSILGASMPSILSLDSNDARMVAIKGLPAGYELTGGDLIGWSDERWNLFTWTEDFANAAWGGSGVTLTDQGGGVWRLQGTGSWQLAQDLTTSEELTRTVAFDVISNTASDQTFRLLNHNFGSVDLTATGAWQRFDFTETRAAGTRGYGITRDTADTSVDLLIRFPQLEEGDTATGYQKVEDGTEFPDTPNYWMHRIVSDVTADGLGETPQFEVVPFIDPGAAPDMAVSLIKPVIKAVMEPDPSYAQDRPAVSSGQQFSFVQTKR